jgi:hypothetical protein
MRTVHTLVTLARSWMAEVEMVEAVAVSKSLI